MSDLSDGITFRTIREAMTEYHGPAELPGLRGIASTSAGLQEAVVGTTAMPHRAAACGARTRAGGSCLGAAMVNGRCRMHGGASTGPRTAVGLARMVAAKTMHGRFAAGEAPKRLAQRFVRTLCARIALTDDATMLQAYLPAGMSARLDSAPAELGAPKHPSQVAFEARCAAAGRTVVPMTLGLGRRARVVRARLGAGGGVADDAAMALHGRATERLAMRVETASQSPWRAAIAAARGLKRAMREARRQRRATRNHPIRGTAVEVAGQTWDVRNDPIRGSAVEVSGQTRDMRNDPIRGAAAGAGGQTWDVRNDPIRGTAVGAEGQSWDMRNDPIRGSAVGAGGQTWDVRNDPIRGSAAQTCATAAPLDKRVGVLAERRANETALWAPGSPGLGAALAREVEKRRLRAEVGVRGNDPICGNASGAGAAKADAPAGGAVGMVRVAPAVTGLASTRALALGSTQLARTWGPSVAEVLVSRFGPAMVEGWRGRRWHHRGSRRCQVGVRRNVPIRGWPRRGRASWVRRQGGRCGDEGGDGGAVRSSLTRFATLADLSRQRGRGAEERERCTRRGADGGWLARASRPTAR